MNQAEIANLLTEKQKAAGLRVQGGEAILILWFRDRPLRSFGIKEELSLRFAATQFLTLYQAGKEDGYQLAQETVGEWHRPLGA